MVKVGCSNRSPRTKHMIKVISKQKLGLPECPYLIRWALEFGSFSIRLHYWKASDDQEYYHDHAWWFATFVLFGSYIDSSPDGYTGGDPDSYPVKEDKLHIGSFRIRPANHIHKVKVKDKAITLLVTGPDVKQFGFWVKGKWIQARRFFFQVGHHPCDGSNDRVKTKPGNS